MLTFVSGLLLAALTFILVFLSSGVDHVEDMSFGFDETPYLDDPASSWEAETRFLEDIFKSFGAQKLDYNGPQRKRGFKGGKIFDDKGMFAFEDWVTSVAIDIAAMWNPLVFDLDVDAGQISFAFEAYPMWLWPFTLVNERFESEGKELQAIGGCDRQWDPRCHTQRLYYWPAGVWTKVGYSWLHPAVEWGCHTLEDSEKEHDNGTMEIDPELSNSHDDSVRHALNACMQSLGTPFKVRTVTLESIMRRIPERLRVKYLKIEAPYNSYKVLLGAKEHLHRVDWVRFQMQVDPKPNRAMVKGLPPYAEILSTLKGYGFTYESNHACNFVGATPLRLAINESQCVFCRELPCLGSRKAPLGPSVQNVGHQRRLQMDSLEQTLV
mmetsp:Transcript_27113/g.43448  ORF Transcript_27113/g.43448 Transcript_27113/m.43448 type:complete len:381 (-) Transcript_27113:10-1152(-)